MLGACLVMTPGVLSRHVDIEAMMPVMLERAHAQATAGELGDDLLDKRGLARVLVTDERDRWDDRGGSWGRWCSDGRGAVASGGLGSSSLTLRAIPHARAAALLVQQAHVDNLHAAVDGLAHVVDGQARGARAGQRLHLNARLARHTCRDQHVKADLPVRTGRRPALGRLVGRRPRRSDGRNVALALGNEQRMAHGDDVARAFDGHDARHACAGEHVALLGAVLQHHGLRLRMHEDGTLGNGDAVRLGLVGYVDHAHLALGVHVRQFVAARVAGGRGVVARGRLHGRGRGVFAGRRGFVG